MSLGDAISYDSGTTRESLRELAVAVQQKEEARPANDAIPPLALWWKLVEGRWRLVEQFDRGGRRYYVAYESPRGTPRTALSPKERLLVALVGSGQSEKAAGFALGVGPSTLSSMLKATLVKLGLRSRTDLVLFMHAVGLSHDEVIAATPRT